MFTEPRASYFITAKVHGQMTLKAIAFNFLKDLKQDCFKILNATLASFVRKLREAKGEKGKNWKIIRK